MPSSIIFRALLSMAEMWSGEEIALWDLVDKALRVQREIPGATVEVTVKDGDRFSELIGQDSYSYSIANIYLGAHDEAELSAWDDGPPDKWWYLCYRAPEPHLRLRIRFHDARTYGSAARHLGAWADCVRGIGLLRNVVLDTYYPEVGRYGTGAAMHAAEAVFAADSTVAIAQLIVTAKGTSHRYAVIAASITDLATAFTGSLNSGMNWLSAHINHHPTPALARDIHGQAMRLADPSGDWAALRAVPSGQQLALA